MSLSPSLLGHCFCSPAHTGQPTCPCAPSRTRPSLDCPFSSFPTQMSPPPGSPPAAQPQMAPPQALPPSIKPEHHQAAWAPLTPPRCSRLLVPVSEGQEGFHPWAKQCMPPGVIRGVLGLRGVGRPDSPSFGGKSLPLTQPQFPHLYHGDETGPTFHRAEETPEGACLRPHQVLGPGQLCDKGPLSKQSLSASAACLP